MRKKNQQNETRRRDTEMKKAPTAQSAGNKTYEEDTSDIWDALVRSEPLSLENPGPMDYTVSAVRRIYSAVDMDIFQTENAQTILTCLLNSLYVVSFQDYLKRYMYMDMSHSGLIDQPFGKVSDEVYIERLKDIFVRGHYPYKLLKDPPREKRMKISQVVSRIFRGKSTSREMVLVLGFVLNMSVENVSKFLTDAIRESDLDMRDPVELTCWYCYRNGLSIFDFRNFMEKYDQLETVATTDDHLREEMTTRVKSRMLLIDSEEALFENLALLKGIGRRERGSRTAYKEFVDAYDRCKGYIAELKGYGPDGADRVSNNDLEEILYSGTPRNRSGNMLPIKKSLLRNTFESTRLSRQRVSNILDKKTPVLRYDLITILFLEYTSFTESDPKKRCLDFIYDINGILEKSSMGNLNMNNPYEAFIIMCLLCEYPYDAYNDVWEEAYEEA